MTLALCNESSQVFLSSPLVTPVSLTLTTKTADYGYDSPHLLMLMNEAASTTDYHYCQTTLDNGQTEHRWTLDKSILTCHSPYFAAMLEYDFYESTSSIVCLPATILTLHGLTSVIQYMYHTRDQASTTAGWRAIYNQVDKQLVLDGHTISGQDKLQLLQDTYSAADYFGLGDLCIQVADTIGVLVHGWTCHCEECLDLIPQLFDYLDTRMTIYSNSPTTINHIINSITKPTTTKASSVLTLQNDPLNRLYAKTVLSLTHDPEKCLPTFWTHRMMARMLDQLPTDHALMLSQRLCKRINKSNAVESLHACFLASTQLSTLDPLLCWSRSLHGTLASAQSKATLYISRHFEYYCSQYPALLSCIDGITYSFDFLEYLFMHVLEDQMDLMNAGLLYQGLVRDLICRHAVQYHDQVRHILNVAKDIILQYMSPRLDEIQKLAALDVLDTDTLKALAIDLDVPARSLVRSLTKHQGLVQQSLLTILFPPPKISYPSSSSASINMSRRSSTITHRTHSLQSNAASTYSYNTYHRNRMSPSSSSPAILQWVKDWIGDNHHHHHHPPGVRSSASSTTATTKSTLFSWTTVPLRSPKKKRGWLHRIMHSDVLMSKQAQRKAMIVVVGKRVQLNRRPVLTVGTVKYVGTVSFAEGIWVGVELDRRVGKNDGSVEGERYFTTSPNRGVFVRSDDLKVMF